MRRTSNGWEWEHDHLHCRQRLFSCCFQHWPQYTIISDKKTIKSTALHSEKRRAVLFV
ncbi:hypothetical protein FAEPRAA2165_00663 [Faecalibacterium duncaniae]|uniref:Uncharacterized protein n=1 Tax=Faecalibacterium duncaniae (strain DSM 17677 / JCM 31915 / A2-165) TaxID=411483 RepID=C7H315_FAED2|nr:hypothetical protein FAEPRAA2165_00663 [Faecalibacterium duncaniae]